MSSDTHLGYSKIAKADKPSEVNRIFSSVAVKYDLMNDLMSFGMHRGWKNSTINHLHLYNGIRILDLAAGSGDLSKRIRDAYPSAVCTLADPSEPMLNNAIAQLSNWAKQYVICSAEQLPFPPASFDRVVIGFGFRNFTDQQQSLHEIYRVLSSDGMIAILEFSKPNSKLVQNLYQSYAQNILPSLGEAVCNNRDAYQYLVESIDVHPNASEVSEMLRSSGFTEIECHSYAAGLVRLHIGQKWD